MTQNIVLSEEKVDVARLINNLNKVEFKFLSKKFRELQISDVQALVIIAIFNSKREIHQKDLEKQFGVSNPTMTQSIQSMIKKDLITRTRSAKDKRFYALNLSEKGKKLYPKCMATYIELESIIDSVLSKNEKKQFTNTMLKLISAFKDYN